MSKINVCHFFFLFLLCFMSATTQCVVKGSETVVSVEPSASFPAADIDNTMLGFGWFKNGFMLEDLTTTCTFNAVYPVSGLVDMHGGTLILLEDLIFHNVTTLDGWGMIVGNNHALDLCTSITALPSDATTFSNTNIFLNDDLVLTSTITMEGNCSFNGHGHSLIMGTNGALVIAPNTQVAFQGMEIKGIRGTNIQCADETSTLLLNDVVWEQSGDYTFTEGSILLQDVVSFMGTSTFSYSSNQTSTLDSNSTWVLTNGIHLNIGRDPNTNNEPMYFTDSTSVMKLSNCSYDIASTGISLTRGTLFFENNVSAHINSSSYATGVMIGTGNPADDFTVYFAPGCSINHYGHMTYNNSHPNGFNSTSNSTLLTRHTNSHVLANTSFQMPEITVQLVSNLVPPIAITPGASLFFNQTAIILPSVSFEVTGVQQNNFIYTMPGNGVINLSKGSLPLAVVAQNTGNQLLGNGNFDGPIILANASAALSFAINGYVGNTLTLNNGTVTLGNDLTLYNSGIIVGPGTVNLGNRVLRVNNAVSSWTTPINWEVDGGSISIDQKLSLASTWTIQGTCVFDGNNNELEFLTDGQIVIAPNSELYLKNLRLQSIQDVNISCVDNTGVLVLDNVYWTQTADYRFLKGSMSIVNEVDLVGSYTFFYESTQTSTINVKSTLTARDHLNFSIGKQQVMGAQEPLMLTDSSSLIVIDNAQWSITGDGMWLTNGRAICVDDVLIDIASTDSTKGLKLGDTTQEKDMIFEFRPGTTVRMPRGHVVCDWYADNNVKSQSTTAQLIRGADNAFYCNCDIVLSNLTIVTEPGAPLIMASGKTFGYENCNFNVPGGHYTLNGEFYNAYTNLLAGSDSLTLSRGILPLYTVINGTDNVLDGNGTVNGQIIYVAPNADLTWSVNGSLANDLSLNGGTLNLNVDMHIANGALINGPGIVDLMSYSLRFGSQDLVANTPINFNSNGGQIELKSSLSLSSTWTITGNCTIQGNGNSIDLGESGEIIIDTGSTLCLHDITLKNVSNNNIQCVDNAGVLILDDVIWTQLQDDYTFAKGAIIVRDDVLMTGGHAFTYSTQQTSTINSHAVWSFDKGMTLNYAPSIASKNLLAFADSTSTLSFDETMLNVSSVGLQLIKGALLIDGVCSLQVTGTNAATGFTLGDGISSMNDLELVVLPESSLNIATGYVNYQNVS